MTKCDYYGEKIGLFSVMYTWLDKKDDLAVHDKCLREWYEKLQDKPKILEKPSQIDYKTLSENDYKNFSENEIHKFLFGLDVERNDFKKSYKNILYLLNVKPKITRTKDDIIRLIEEDIERTKKYENFSDKEKEKMLKFLNFILINLKELKL